jgi:RND family efflux transporter MFP subunit
MTSLKETPPTFVRSTNAARGGAGRIGALLQWVAAVAFVAACDGRESPRGEAAGGAATRPTAVDVRVARVVRRAAPRVVRATGSFFADDQAVIGAEVSGRVAEIGPEVGDRTAGGALLARVDEADYALIRAQKERMLAESLVKLGLERLPEGEIDFDVLPSVERAKLEAANASARYERAATLHSRTPPLISEQDLADLRTARDVATSALSAARLLVRGELAQARTRRTELDAADKKLRDVVHRAPAGGATWLVAERRVAVGDYVSVGSPLYRLVDADPLKLRVRVPERRMEGVVAGRRAAVTTAADSRPIEGRVSRLRPEVDPRNRTYEVEIETPNPGSKLTVGSFAVAEIDVGVEADAAFVRADSVVTFAGVRKVFTVVEARIVERLVVIGRRDGPWTEIVEGLKAGDAYVVAPPPSLVAGSPVRVVASPDSAEAPEPR